MQRVAEGFWTRTAELTNLERLLPTQLEPSWSEWCRTLVVLAHQSEE